MQIGLVGLGRMGFNMSLRLHRAGQQVISTDRGAAKIQDAQKAGLHTASTAEELLLALQRPRAVWAMIPSGKPVDDLIERLMPLMTHGDIFVDGGNSNYHDSVRRAEHMAHSGVTFLDVGVSGGIWGLENGYCLMAGGPKEAVERLRPVFDALAPPDGWLHAGPSGAGHFAKMVHNGIEYALMEAYGEGFELLQASDYGYDLAAIAHLWNQGSVVRSWLLELTERALADDPKLEQIRGHVEDSGEGRWTVHEAIARGVPASVLALSLFARFDSRQQDAFRNRMIAALRHQFGGHAVQAK